MPRSRDVRAKELAIETSGQVELSGRTMDIARRLKRLAPDLFTAMREKRITLWQANRELKARVKTEKALASGAEEIGEDLADADGWELAGKHYLIRGHISDWENDPAYPIPASVKLAIVIVEDKVDDLRELRLTYQWLLKHAMFVAVCMKPDHLAEVLPAVQAPVLWVFSCTLTTNTDQRDSVNNSWFPTIVFGDDWYGIDVSCDSKRFVGDDATNETAGYAAGGRPRAYFEWLVKTFTNQADTVLVANCIDGQALFAIDNADRRAIVIEPTWSEVVLGRWAAERGGIAKADLNELRSRYVPPAVNEGAQGGDHQATGRSTFFAKRAK